MKKTENGRALITIGLCFVIALLEGVDLQSAGIAAPGMQADFELTQGMLGAMFSAGILGLLPGALIGGRMADRVGRKKVLIVSVLLFGLFSLLTAMVWEFYGLLLARFMTGVGLGAALPNLIALCSEAVDEKYRGRAVSLMYCGMPIGGIFVSLLAMSGFFGGWKFIFYVGGLAPLLVVPLMILWLPESRAFSDTTANRPNDPPQSLAAIFQNGLATPTILLWISYFFTLMVVYMLLNWLPSLLVGQGFTKTEASTVQMFFSLGAATGTIVLGQLLDRWKMIAVIALMYTGILVALLALGNADNLHAMIVAGATAGFFTIGGQMVLYALGTLFYPIRIRATGLGAAIAVGRLGAMSGPAVAGQLLAMGGDTAGVLMASSPGIIVSALAIFYLLLRKHPATGLATLSNR